MQIEQMKEELFMWGKWSRSCPSLSMSYPHETPFNRYRGASGGGYLSISDDRALEIDQSIAKIFTGDEVTIQLLIGHFKYCLNYRELGERVGMSKDRANRLTDNAISWIAGYFMGRVAA